MKINEAISILDNMRHYVVSLDRSQRDALAIAVEVMRRLDQRLPERPTLIVGPPMPVSLEDEAS